MAPEPAKTEATTAPRDATVHGAQSFAIRCSCGRTIRGRRHQSHRAVSCPACGAALFILPRNPRPRPRTPGAGDLPRHARPAATGRQRAAVSVAASSLPKLLRRRGRPSTLTSSGDVLKPRRAPVLTGRRVSLVLAAVAALLAIGLAWHVRRQSHYDQVLKLAGEEAEAAFLAGDFLAAADRAHAAAEAARILGDDSPRGRAALQLDREAHIWSRLALTPLDALVESIEQNPSVGKRNDAAARAEFERQFAGRTVIIDTWATSNANSLAAAPGSLAPNTFIALEWNLPGENARLELAPIGPVDQPVFQSLATTTPTRLLLGVELESIEPSEGQSGTWRIRVRPSSVTLLTMPEPLARANWPTTEDLDPILAQQRKWIMGDQP